MEVGDDWQPSRRVPRGARLPGRWRSLGQQAYYARDDAEVDDLAGDQLERFSVLAVFELATLVDAGFELVPTFRTHT